jgi:hypothetical protein
VFVTTAEGEAKHQAPISKHQRNSKLQAPNDHWVAVIITLRRSLVLTQGPGNVLNDEKVLAYKVLPTLLLAAVIKKKRKSLYYLFPGQGDGARHRRIRNRIVSVLVGVMVSGLVAWLMYFFYHLSAAAD